MVFGCLCCLRSSRRIKGGIPLEAGTDGVRRKEGCHDRAENQTIFRFWRCGARVEGKVRKDKKGGEKMGKWRDLEFIVRLKNVGVA